MTPADLGTWLGVCLSAGLILGVLVVFMSWWRP